MADGKVSVRFPAARCIKTYLIGGYMKAGFKEIILAVCVVLFPGLPGVVYADMYLKYKQHTDGFTVMGQNQPAKDTIRETWVAKDMIRTDEGGNTIIMRHDKKRGYFIDNSQMVYSEAPMEIEKIADKSIKEDEDMGEEDKASARQFMRGMMQGMTQFTMTVRETGEKKKIGKWNCTKYLQDINMGMGPSNSEVWATKDIKLDYELLNKMSVASLMMMPGARENIGKITKEMNKIKGISVYTVSKANMMNIEMTSTQELIDFADKKTRAGFYEPPKGYKSQKPE